ncbi:hypothetical protein HIM_10336 [Hirsutella minnesotensis 3608]|uniref:LysM domain-containing protein n=1 Tax=Hirsutella minnesotensis 3608 TaxID=1043627 RepID=A0A0F7ZK67_9HYPO|nr:hypothetical protein HIM_10336 [Hirsutella minnesotensis 3608]
MRIHYYGQQDWMKQFLEWNPAVGSSGCSNLVPDDYVCVAGGASTSSRPLPTASSGQSSSSTTKTDPSPTPITTPSPTRGTLVSGCRRFYKTQKGDGCWAIANSAAIELDDFYKWNPEVKTDCSGLWLGYWYCIGIDGPVTTISSGPPVPTAKTG